MIMIVDSKPWLYTGSHWHFTAAAGLACRGALQLPQAVLGSGCSAALQQRLGHQRVSALQLLQLIDFPNQQC